MNFLKYHYNNWAFYHTFSARESMAPQPGKPVTSSCFCVCAGAVGSVGAGAEATTVEPGSTNQHGNSWNGECISHVSAMYH